MRRRKIKLVLINLKYLKAYEACLNGNTVPQQAAQIKCLHYAVVFMVAKFCNLVICFQEMKIWKTNSTD